LVTVEVNVTDSPTVILKSLAAIVTPTGTLGEIVIYSSVIDEHPFVVPVTAIVVGLPGRAVGVTVTVFPTEVLRISAGDHT
jgi:hypothetical protein